MMANNKPGNRHVRQFIAHRWAERTFGKEHTNSLEQRAIRALEEMIELYQRCGGHSIMAHELIEYVFNRPVGDLKQEIGGVGLTLLILGQTAGVNVDIAEEDEFNRVLVMPTEHFVARNKEKNKAGFLAIHIQDGEPDKSLLPRICTVCWRDTQAPLFDGCMNENRCPYGFKPCL